MQGDFCQIVQGGGFTDAFLQGVPIYLGKVALVGA